MHISPFEFRNVAILAPSRGEERRGEESRGEDRGREKESASSVKFGARRENRAHGENRARDARLVRIISKITKSRNRTNNAAQPSKISSLSSSQRLQSQQHGCSRTGSRRVPRGTADDLVSFSKPLGSPCNRTHPTHSNAGSDQPMVDADVGLGWERWRLNRWGGEREGERERRRE